MRRLHLWASVGFAVTAAVSSAAAQLPATITAQPGDVVRVEGKASVFGKTWTDLIGVDLDTKPGTYRISRETVLIVRPKQFPVRHLTVAPEFVTPPPEAMKQILA